MGLVATSLALLGVAADSIGVAQAITACLRRGRDGTAAELFKKCFHLAVTRHRTRLLHFCQGCQTTDIRVDDAALEAAVAELEQQDDVALPVPSFESITPAFRNCIILPGHQLPDPDLNRELQPLVRDCLTDFFSRLPSTPDAFREIDLGHVIASADDAAAQADSHATQEATLHQIEESLGRIEARQNEISEDDTYLDPTVIQQESSRPEHHNPFRIVKAEDFDHDYTRLAFLFREPSDYEHIRGPDNLIIAGGRGCGKSMILRSLSLDASIALARLRGGGAAPTQSPPHVTYAEAGLAYFGVYIKLARGYFYEWSPDCKLTQEAATMLFQHVFNMLLLKSLLESLLRARDGGVIAISAIQEQTIVRRIKGIGAFDFAGETFDALLAEVQRQENHVAQYLGHLRLGTQPSGYQGRLTYIHNCVDQCCQSVLDAIPDLVGSRVFFLLDEYENLDTFQQSVVNTLAKLRPLSLTLKIATRPLGVKSRADLQGEPIQVPRDYHQVELDYNIEDKRYRRLLLDIAFKRLNSERYRVADVRQLLESPPPFHPASEAEVDEALRGIAEARDLTPCEKGDKSWQELFHQWGHALVYRLSARRTRQPRTYAGFDDFADLSSGIISNFLELCKMAFYRAEGEGIIVREGQAIPWQVQSKAVYSVSKACLDWIPRNIEQTGPAISRFVLDISDVFRDKLLQHASEPEAGRLAIHDPESLDKPEYEVLRRVLDDAVRWSVFHQCGQSGSYLPKHKSDVRASEFYLNRILTPILRISPRPRWRTGFRVADLAGLLDSSTRARVRNSLIKGGTTALEAPLFEGEDAHHE